MSIENVEEHGLFENISSDEVVNKTKLFCEDSEDLISFGTVVEAFESGLNSIVNLIDLLTADDLGEFFEVYNQDYENILEFKNRIINGATNLLLCNAFSSVGLDLIDKFREEFGEDVEGVITQIETAYNELEVLYEDYTSEELNLDSFEEALESVGVVQKQVISDLDSKLSNWLIDKIILTLGDDKERVYIDNYPELKEELDKISFIDLGTDLTAFVKEMMSIIYTYFYKQDAKVINEEYLQFYENTLSVANEHIAEVKEIEQDFDVWSFLSINITKGKILLMIDKLGSLGDGTLTLDELSLLYQFFVVDLIEFFELLDKHLYLIAFKKIAYPINQEIKALNVMELRKDFIVKELGIVETIITPPSIYYKSGMELTYRNNYSSSTIYLLLTQEVTYDESNRKSVEQYLFDKDLTEKIDLLVFGEVRKILVSYFKETFVAKHEKSFKENIFKYYISDDTKSSSYGLYHYGNNTVRTIFSPYDWDSNPLFALEYTTNYNHISKVDDNFQFMNDYLQQYNLYLNQNYKDKCYDNVATPTNTSMNEILYDDYDTLNDTILNPADNILSVDVSGNEGKKVIIEFNEDFLYQMQIEGTFADYSEDAQKATEEDFTNYIEDIKDDVKELVLDKLEPLVVAYGEAEDFVEDIVEDITSEPSVEGFLQYVSNLFELE